MRKGINTLYVTKSANHPFAGLLLRAAYSFLLLVALLQLLRVSAH